MGMDDQYIEMKRFIADLVSFNQALGASMQQLETDYDAVSPLWQDEMRRLFDERWQPFQETMSHYLAHEGRDFVEFLSIRAHHLERYLNG